MAYLADMTEQDLSLPDYIQDLLNGYLEDQTNHEKSRFMDFYLDYKYEQGDILAPFIRQIADDIYDKEVKTGKRQNKRNHNAQRRFIASIRILLLNLIKTNQLRKLLGEKLYLAVSLDRNSFSLQAVERYTPPDITYDPYKDAYEGLIALGLLHVHRQGLHDTVRGNFYLTRIEATSKLLSDFESRLNGNPISISRLRDTEEEECIILRDENKRLANYKDTTFTRKARKNLKKINKFISRQNYTIELSDAILKYAIIDGTQYSINKNYFDTTNIKLRRIFNNSNFTHGGRFYGGWWQSLRSEYRRYLKINEQKTVEWDFSRCHITILYAELGIPMMADPYHIYPNVPEGITKRVINALLNADGMPNQMSDFDDALLGLTWQEFINKIKEVHNPIVDKFMTGYGIILQFKEAEVAEAILIKLMEANIPCLPIHDSFITTEEHSNALREIMGSVFKDRFGIDINIKLKE